MQCRYCYQQCYQKTSVKICCCCATSGIGVLTKQIKNAEEQIYGSETIDFVSEKIDSLLKNIDKLTKNYKKIYSKKEPYRSKNFPCGKFSPMRPRLIMEFKAICLIDKDICEWYTKLGLLKIRRNNLFSVLKQNQIFILFLCYKRHRKNKKGVLYNMPKDILKYISKFVWAL